MTATATARSGVFVIEDDGDILRAIVQVYTNDDDLDRLVDVLAAR